jgi:hypothetical protein
MGRHGRYGGLYDIDGGWDGGQKAVQNRVVLLYPIRSM